MFVRWDRRWRKRSADYALSAYLAKSERIGGKPRQRVVFLATIREKYLPAPAHRVIFWDTILSRLEDFDQRIGASKEKVAAQKQPRQRKVYADGCLIPSAEARKAKNKDQSRQRR